MEDKNMRAMTKAIDYWRDVHEIPEDYMCVMSAVVGATQGCVLPNVHDIPEDCMCVLLSVVGATQGGVGGTQAGVLPNVHDMLEDYLCVMPSVVDKVAMGVCVLPNVHVVNKCMLNQVHLY